MRKYVSIIQVSKQSFQICYVCSGNCINPLLRKSYYEKGESFSYDSKKIFPRGGRGKFLSIVAQNFGHAVLGIYVSTHLFWKHYPVQIKGISHAPIFPRGGGRGKIFRIVAQNFGHAALSI